MVKQIVRDIFFLGQPSEPATKADIQIGKDLQDTLQANRERCVGMAANMIGVKKNIIFAAIPTHRSRFACSEMCIRDRSLHRNIFTREREL